MENYSNVKVTHKQMPTNQFISLPEVFCQRDTELRVTAAAKRLKQNLQPTHLDVKLARYPDGKLVVIDGNTRRLAWERNLAPKPNEVHATIYDVIDDNQAKDLYETLDSQLAVERSANRLQSAIKIVWKDTPTVLKSSTIKNGNFLNGIKYASKDLFLNDGKLLGWKGNIDTAVLALRTYQFEINEIDKLIWNEEEELKTHQNQITAMLLILKKYHHLYHTQGYETLLEGLKHWLRCDRLPMDRVFHKKNQRYTVKGTHSKYRNQVDPITFMNNYDWRSLGFDVKGASGTDIPYTLDKYLYCLDNFMKGKYMAKLSDTSYVYKNWMRNVDYKIAE